MTITKEAVLKALSYVEEPDLGQDLVTLNMIENIEIDGRTVAFTVVLTTPACPLKQLIHDACERAIHTMVDAEANVVITMTSRVTTLRNPRTELLPGVKNIIAIASGKGGVGKSTVTANLAVALAATGAKVGLVDADISGPSVPVMFDVENAAPHVFQGPNGKNLIQPIEKYGVKLMSIGFLAPAESRPSCGVGRWPRRPSSSSSPRSTGASSTTCCLTCRPAPPTSISHWCRRCP